MGCGHGILANNNDFDGDGARSANSPSPRSRHGSVSTPIKRGFSPARILLDSMAWGSSSQLRTLKIGPAGNNHQWAGAWNVPVALLGSASDECCRAIAVHLKPHLIQKDEVLHSSTDLVSITALCGPQPVFKPHPARRLTRRPPATCAGRWQVLFREGDEGTSLYFVNSGRRVPAPALPPAAPIQRVETACRCAGASHRAALATPAVPPPAPSARTPRAPRDP